MISDYIKFTVKIKGEGFTTNAGIVRGKTMENR
jgi:hypothetical protein